MSLLHPVLIPLRCLRAKLTERMLWYRILLRNPSLTCHHTVIWDYSWKHVDAIRIGAGVAISAFAELLVYKHAARSSKEGGLVLGDGVIIANGAHIRAAGGIIRIGRYSAVGQHSVLVAANHAIVRGRRYMSTPWEETRTGIEVGENVWIAAGVVILPGVTIGDNAVIAAGSVVADAVPANEIWGGVPARKLKDVPPAESPGS